VIEDIYDGLHTKVNYRRGRWSAGVERGVNNLSVGKQDLKKLDMGSESEREGASSEICAGK